MLVFGCFDDLKDQALTGGMKVMTRRDNRTVKIRLWLDGATWYHLVWAGQETETAILVGEEGRREGPLWQQRYRGWGTPQPEIGSGLDSLPGLPYPNIWFESGYFLSRPPLTLEVSIPFALPCFSAPRLVAWCPLGQPLHPHCERHPLLPVVPLQRGQCRRVRVKQGNPWWRRAR